MKMAKVLVALLVLFLLCDNKIELNIASKLYNSQTPRNMEVQKSKCDPIRKISPNVTLKYKELHNLMPT